jgi:hypothetical protein
MGDLFLRRLTAEAVGTFFLFATVIGSALWLSVSQAGLAL